MSIATLLAELRRVGEPVALGELAKRITASPAPPPPAVARRLVGAVLQADPACLPELLERDWLRPPPERVAASLPLVAGDFAVVDLETTGVARDRCEILEVGAVRVSGLAIADEFESLVRPEGDIPMRIERLTGIGPELVGDAPPLATVMREFVAWLGRTPKAAFVAHNALFDHGFVERALQRCELAPLSRPVFCTRKLGRRLVSEAGRWDLDHLCAHFGFSNPARHRALGDARVTARLLCEILGRALDSGVQTMGGLLDLQERALRRKRRSGSRARRSLGSG